MVSHKGKMEKMGRMMKMPMMGSIAGLPAWIHSMRSESGTISP